MGNETVVVLVACMIDAGDAPISAICTAEKTGKGVQKEQE